MAREGRWKNRLLAAASVLATLVVLEAGVRVANREALFAADNYLVRERDLSTSAYPSEYHELLGWAPRPNFDSNRNKWGTRVTIDGRGLRVNGNPAPPAGAPLILCVGDSFTFGDEASNSETWPAALERLTGARVENGGVFGYGFDQTVLRAELLAPELDPDILVLSVVTSDIPRCELSMRMGVSKPYFAVMDGGLELRNTPPPKPDTELDPLRRALGYSRLAHWILSKLAPGWWLSGCWSEERAHERGEDVACLLCDRVARLASPHTRCVIFLQYWGDTLERPASFDRLIACAQARSIQVVDLMPELQAAHQEDPARFEALFDGHMTARGNEFAAQVLAQGLGLAP